MRGNRVVMILGALVLTTAAGPRCGGQEAPAPAAPDLAEQAPKAEPTKPSHPQTEAALVEAFAAALEARDIDALGALAAPELAADLRRMHDQDPAAFWGRGQKLVANVKGGFEVAAKQEGREDRWRALLKFTSGDEETVVFTRVNGKLVFHEL